jgi:hypothetical protein
LPAEHDELMSQQEQLDVSSELAAPAADQQPQHSREGEIGERKEHAPDAPIARYRAQDEQERRSRTSVKELRGPTRSDIRARAREPSKPRLNQRNRADAAHRTGILKPLTHRALALAPPDARNTANRSANQHIERLDLLGGLIHEYRAAA